MFADTETRGGMMSCLRRLVENGATFMEARMELFSVELQKERRRMIEMMLLTGLAIAVGTLALGMVSLGALVLFWDSARIEVLSGLCVFYSGLCLSIAFALQRRLDGPRPFQASLDQLKKDCECLHRN